MNAYLREAIEEAIHEIADKKIEHAIVLDLEGEELWRGTGTKSKVAIARDFALRGQVFIHNHPSSSWFSAEDLEFAWTYNAALLVVTSPHFVYILERPASGWPRGLAQSYDKLRGDMHVMLTRVSQIHNFYYRRFPRARPGVTFIGAAKGPAEECWK